MQLIDVHCHLDSVFYKEDIDEVVERARKNKTRIIANGINPETNREVLALVAKYPKLVYGCLGLYPRDALKKDNESGQYRINTDYDIDKELEFIHENKDRIVGLGEVGMDFKDGSDFEEQESTFRKVIELAMKLDKPLVIHSRKAEERVIEILEEYDYQKIVMHCFGGKTSLVKRIREHQWMFSIPTSIVRDEHFQKIIKETQLNLILTETDSPFLSPFREQRNEPSYVAETIKKISELRNMPQEDVANILYRNAQRVFGMR